MDRSDAILCGLSAVASAGVLWTLRRAHILGPGSFPESVKGQRDVRGVPAPIWLVAAAMVFLTQAFVVGMLRQAPASTLGEGLQRDALTSLIVYGTALTVGVLLAWLIRSQSSGDAGLRAGANDLGRGIVGFLAVAPLCVVVNYICQGLAWLVTHEKPDPVAHDVLRQIVDQHGSPAAVMLIVGAVLLAPAVEELMYRGFLQSCLLATLGRVWPAIIGTSCLFAAMHVTVVPPHALPVLLTLALGMGVAFERTRSLGVPIVMHALFNAANVLIAVLAHTAN